VVSSLVQGFFPHLARSIADSAQLREAVKQAVRDLSASSLQTSSVNDYLRAIRAFLAWLHEEQHSTELIKVAYLKAEQKTIATFNSQQVERVLRWKPRTFSQFRLQALTSTLLDSGLRIQEALELRREQIDFDNMLMSVKGKGQKHRMVPISFELRKVLFRWLGKHEYPLVYPTRQGTRLTQRNLLRELKALGRTLRITGVRFSFHTFRHTFAVNYIRAGGNLYYLSRILGHASVKTTERYLGSLGAEDLRAVHDKLSLLNPAR
jgi:integrase/recombinase XerD